MNFSQLTALAESTLNQGPFNEFRGQNLALFKEQGFPGKGESYKFTNMARYFEELQTEQGLHSIPEAEEGAFVLVDGKLISSPSIPGLTARSLMKEDLASLSKDSPLSHLHHGLMGQGLLLELDKNTELKEPVRLIHILGLDQVTAPTVVIKLGRFSRMSLVEETRSSMQQYALLGESYAELAEGAKLEHVQVDSGTPGSIHHASTWASVGKDSSYTNFIFHLDGKLRRRNLDIKLLAPGANGESYGLFLTSGKEHSDINTVINHLYADTTSNQIAKGVLDDESKGVFTGKIHIYPKAQRVISGQLNKNLLLSKKAQVHSQPQLEIFADDVKCSHGSTTGQMSEEELFYFETRGIPKDRARTLLAFGFGLEVVLKIQNLRVRKTLETKVMEALKEKFKIGGAHERAD